MTADATAVTPARDDVEVAGHFEPVSEPLMQGAVRQPAVAHPGERVESLCANPIRRAFVAEELAPPADAVADALALAVGHRSGAGDDVDAVFTGEGAGPAAHHVVVAAVAVVAEHACGDLVERFDVAAGLAVAGQAEECGVDVLRGDARLGADIRNALRQRLFDDLEAVVEVVGGRRGGAGDDASVVVDERERGLRAAAVDSEITGHRYSPLFVMG